MPPILFELFPFSNKMASPRQITDHCFASGYFHDYFDQVSQTNVSPTLNLEIVSAVNSENGCSLIKEEAITGPDLAFSNIGNHQTRGNLEMIS